MYVLLAGAFDSELYAPGFHSCGANGIELAVVADFCRHSQMFTAVCNCM